MCKIELLQKTQGVRKNALTETACSSAIHSTRIKVLYQAIRTPRTKILKSLLLIAATHLVPRHGP
jgi:hypothetical protein